jgi:3',5'-cyclic AMP phosphodiesterase CpdA
MRPLVVAHLSDLHVTGDIGTAYSDPIEHLRSSVPQHAPDIIVVTGDLVETPWPGSLKKARDFLVDLCKKTNLPETRLLIIPGNHDYKIKGFLGGQIVDFFTGAANPSNFKEVFPQFKYPFISVFGDDPDLPPISVFGFDSNTTEDALNLATGRIEDKQISEFANLIKNHEKRAIIDGSYKIAILHHHCMPIADSETGRMTDRDAFLVMDNAGTFMTEMTRYKVDLILHGHKHYFGMSSVKMHDNRQHEHTITVVGSGTACKDGTPEFSYNVIKVYPDGIVSLQRWFRKTGSFKTEDNPPVILRDYGSLREKNFASALEKFQSTARTRSLRIDRNGSGFLHDEYRDIKLISEDTRESLNSLPFKMSSIVGMIQEPILKARTPDLADPKFVRSPGVRTPTDNLVGTIVFDQSFSTSVPISFDTDCEILNGFFFDHEDRQRVTSDKSDVEYVTGRAFGKCRMLSLVVRFPDPEKDFTFEPASVFVHVEDSDGKRVIPEEEYCQQFLYYSSATRTASMTVPKPQTGLKYKLSWRLPSASVSRPVLPPLIEGQASRIVDCLLEKVKLLVGDPKTLFDSSFMKLKAEIVVAWPDKGPSPPDPSISLMVYDHAIGKIRCVASTLPSDHWSWRWEPRMGQGIAGQACRSDEAIFSFPHVVNDRAARAYVRPSFVPREEDDPYVVVSVPLRYPPDSSKQQGRIIGILNLNSLSPTTGLLDLYGKKDKQDFLIGRIYSPYLGEMLSSLGFTPTP